MTNCVKRHCEVAGKEHPARSAGTETSLMTSLKSAPIAAMRALLTLLLCAVLLLKHEVMLLLGGQIIRSSVFFLPRNSTIW